MAGCTRISLLDEAAYSHTWYQLCGNVDQHIEMRKQVIDIRVLRVKEDAYLMLHCQFGDLY
jgi:hypothetical protein